MMVIVLVNNGHDGLLLVLMVEMVNDNGFIEGLLMVH